MHLRISLDGISKDIRWSLTFLISDGVTEVACKGRGLVVLILALNTSLVVDVSAWIVLGIGVVVGVADT